MGKPSEFSWYLIQQSFRIVKLLQAYRYMTVIINKSLTVYVIGCVHTCSNNKLFMTNFPLTLGQINQQY